jgi:hypothetical protein
LITCRYDILVEAEFTSALEDVEKMRNLKSKNTILNKLNGSDLVVFTRDNVDIKKRNLKLILKFVLKR